MTIQLQIEGMTCQGCERSVSQILSSQPGVTAVRVDLGTGQAAVEGTADSRRLIEAVEGGGFDARVVN